MTPDPIHVYGVAPVQGFGRVGEHCWYFRARGWSWSLDVGPEDERIAGFVDEEVAVWSVWGDWGVERPGMAGWIPEPVAVRLVEAMLARFLAAAPGGEQEADLFLGEALAHWAERRGPGRAD